MRASTKLAALGIVGLLAAGAGPAWSQPAGPASGPAAGPAAGPAPAAKGRPGMMHHRGGHHRAGPGMHAAYADPAAYLDGLKGRLGIKPGQEQAWTEYADVVKGAAEQMRSAHQTVYAAMGTATWQERRDMMNRMFETREQMHGKVVAAAQKLLPSLDAAQRTEAGTILPGLRARGGMMGRRHHGGQRGPMHQGRGMGQGGMGQGGMGQGGMGQGGPPRQQ